MGVSPPRGSEGVCRGQGIDTQTRPAKSIDAQGVTRKRTLHQSEDQEGREEVWRTDMTPQLSPTFKKIPRSKRRLCPSVC